jgi:hypothetical protein
MDTKAGSTESLSGRAPFLPWLISDPYSAFVLYYFVILKYNGL